MKFHLGSVSLMLSLLLLVIVSTESRADPPSTPIDAVRQYIMAVDAGNYQAAYSLLPNSTQSHVTLEAFKDLQNQKLPDSGNGIVNLKAYMYFVSDFSRKSGYRYILKEVSKDNSNNVIIDVLTPDHKTLSMVIVTVKEDGGYKIDMDATGNMLSRDPGDSKRHQLLCLIKMKQLSQALQIYLVEHGHYPKADHWGDAILPYLPNKDTFYCPSDSSKKCSYAFNVNLSGKDSKAIKYPSETVLLFESSAGKMNYADGGTTVCKPTRHTKGNFYLFADGKVIACASKPNNKHSWKP